MQTGNILDISVAQNSVSVIWYPDRSEESVPSVEIPVVKRKSAPKNTIVKDFLIAAVKQTFSIYKPKTIVFTNYALREMKKHHLSESDVKPTVFSGEYVEGKENMISKKYNGYEIAAIVKHERATNTYKVLSAWKGNRR